MDPLAYLEEMDKAEAADGPKPAAEGEEEQEYDDYGEYVDSEEMEPDALEQKQEADKVMINEAVDEFIQDKKLWFRGLHKEHGEDIKKNAMEKGANFLPGTALYVGNPQMLPIAGELDEE